MALIEIERLKKCFNVASRVNHAVDNIMPKIEKGRTTRIVGELGCGESILGWTITHLHEATDDVIRLGGKDIAHASREGLKQIRERIQIIFQDPYASLNPRVIVKATVWEPLMEAHRLLKTEITRRIEELMGRVGVGERLRLPYPHELDSGWRQRIGIARAIMPNSEFITCGEPVSTPDASIQVQVLNLPMDLQEEYGLTYILVIHDLSVVRHISDDISMMYSGQLVETSPTKELFRRILHSYTGAPLSAIPSVDVHHPMQQVQLKGETTSTINPKPRCRFAPRCPYAIKAYLEPQRLEEARPKHFVSCCRIREISS